MNNNRGGNNRRRGRGPTNNNGNPRPQGANGGQQVNRIDSRARGNAPQMLEKYRKLANDAHLNGDRVNAEYYLQFADHYFRVSADTRVRQEEQRLRRDDRWQEGDDRDESDDSADFSVESEFASFDQPPVYTRREREDRPERSERPERPERIESGPDRVAPDRGQQSQPDTRRRDERPAYEPQAARGNYRNNDANPPSATADQPAPAEQGAAANQNSTAGEIPAETVTAYEPPENPFLRENRGGRGLRPRREDRRPRREDRPETVAQTEMQDSDRAMRAISAGIDPQSLPPSFTVPRGDPPIAPVAVAAEPSVLDSAEAKEAVGEKPARRPRAKRKPAADDTGEPVQSLI